MPEQTPPVRPPRQLYRWTRDLHLYLGLFVSPFILLFAVSVFFLNHGRLPARPPGASLTFHDLQVPDDIFRLQGRDAVNRARVILPQVGLTGEIGFLRMLAKERHLIFPVAKPGVDATVDVDMDARSAVVTRRATSWWEAIAYLHKSPGPHNVNIRGNWFWTRAWGWLADATIYLMLFITISGVYLWLAIKAERKIGAVLLAAGAASFVGLMYAVIR